MAESLLLPVVRGVAGKATDALVQSVTGMWGVDDIRGKLERQLVAVQSKLLDAELKSETDPAVKRWMKDLRAVAYEADDVLDDFQYEALRREVFRKLKEMVLDGLPNLERWAENSAGEPSNGLLVFPRLEKLEMDSCPKLASVPGSPVLN